MGRPFGTEVQATGRREVGEMIGLYARGEDMSVAGALAAETSHSLGRSYDLEAFTAAGSATAARMKGAVDDRSL